MKYIAPIKQIAAALTCGLSLSSSAFAETEAEQAARLKWFTDARFGMFIHFGAYSLAARHEWVKNYENISDADYQKYVENFDPDLFDAKAWVKAAKRLNRNLYSMMPCSFS